MRTQPREGCVAWFGSSIQFPASVVENLGMSALDTRPGRVEAREKPVGRRGPTLEQLWVAVVLATPLIAAFIAKVPATDLAYHVRAGALMLDGGVVLRTDVFTFTVPGEQWLNQQWLAQVLFGGVHRLGGWDLLAALYALALTLSFGLLYLACRASGAGRRLAALLTIVGFWVARQNLSLRPQLLGVLLFALTSWILATRDRRPRSLWLLPAIGLVWANVHGSFVLAPLLIGLTWMQDRRASPARARTLMGLGVLTLAATLVNPFGWRVWGYAVSIGTNSTITSSVTEWAPPSVRTYSGLLFFLSVALVVALLARRATPARWMDLAWLGAFFLLALPALRGVVWWAFAAPIVTARLWPRPQGRKGPPGSPTLNAAFLAALAVVVVLAMPWWRSGSASGAPVWLEKAPQHLAAAAERELPSGSRLFVSQVYASWFEYAVPSMPVFVDSRIELFPTSLWDRYLSVGGAREGWQAILDAWDVDGVVVDPAQDPALREHIRDDPAWELAYEDDDGALFVRS